MRLPKLFFAAVFVTGLAVADDHPFEVTIKVVEHPTDLPGAVTKTIRLPAPASERAEERSQQGLNTANEARERGREFGKSVAEEAKTQGNKGSSHGKKKGKE